MWIPDIKATKCMNCQVTEFSLMNRRHHCRNCGSVVCQNCSSRKLVIPGQFQNVPVRVCDKCFDKLSVSEPMEVDKNYPSNTAIKDEDSESDDFESADENE